MTNKLQVTAPGQDMQRLQEAMSAAETFINQEYMSDLADDNNEVCKPTISSYSDLRLLHLTRIVFNNQDDINMRLMNVYHTIHNMVEQFIMLIQGTNEGVSLYVGIYDRGSAATAQNALMRAIDGNFPGAEYQKLSGEQTRSIMTNISKSTYRNTQNTVVGLSVVPTARTEDSNIFVQGIEKFIDAMHGQFYTTILFARPVPNDEIQQRKHALEELSSALSCLESYTIQLGRNSSHTTNTSITDSITTAINVGISMGYGTNTATASGTQIGYAGNIALPYRNLNLGLGAQNGQFSSTSYGYQQNQGNSYGSSKQTGQSTQSGSSDTEGHSASTSFTQKNTSVSSLIKQLARQLDRIEISEAYGLWESSAYFVAFDRDVAVFAANTYKALVTGKDTNVEKAYLNVWDTNNSGTSMVLRNLQYAEQPLIRLKKHNMLCTLGSFVNGLELPYQMSWPRKSTDGIAVMNKAAFGRQVYILDKNKRRQFVEGNRQLPIGKIYHMGREEDSNVSLNINDLSGHCFIAGAVGTGKTNACASIINEFLHHNIPFMIIEPVKGEYKELFSHVENVQVFSTTPLSDRMLHLNPFRFNNKVHVLEHIDRLIEVFRMCWPMYAAQPALLRECIETAYLLSGWDLTNSVWLGQGLAKYPTFETLLKVLPNVIKQSKFVGESKGTYEGALLSRIRMLTRGIFGQVFGGAYDLSDKDLFDANVIIDLSHTGSPETISLIMGLLVIRLREYLGAEFKPDNRSLRHVTIIEEAHNVFRCNTSIPSGEEGAGVESKSVELLSRCIAEVRGYGEGVMIIDQSPSSVDISSIKNTATKLVFRLPEHNDRQTIGSSLNTTNEQIGEIAQLPTGVAVVYQTDWAEPVLVKFPKYEANKSCASNTHIEYDDLKAVRGYLLKTLLQQILDYKFDYKAIEQACQRIRGFSQAKIHDYIALFSSFGDEVYALGDSFVTNKRVFWPMYARLFMNILGCKDMFRILVAPDVPDDSMRPSANPNFARKCVEWQQQAMSILNKYVSNIDDDELLTILHLLLIDMGNEDPIWFSVRNALTDTI